MIVPCPPVSFIGGTMGTPEVLLILAAVLILFGPEKLPQAARTIGRILEQLRRASRDFTDQITNMEHSVDKPVHDLPPEYVKEIERQSQKDAGRGCCAGAKLEAKTGVPGAPTAQGRPAEMPHESESKASKPEGKDGPAG